ATEDGYEFRSLVKRWMLSDAYRMRPANGDPAWVRRASPERLERLVADLTGFVWRRDPDGVDPTLPFTPIPLLTSEKRGFEIILGGINGTTVSARSRSLNASVAMVHRKVAAPAADYVVR